MTFDKKAYMLTYRQRPEVKIHHREYQMKYRRRLGIKPRVIKSPIEILEAMKKYKEKNKEAINKYQKIRMNRVRLQCLIYYSNGIPKCSRCGFSDIRALQIDHINGGGNKHVKELNGMLVFWLQKNNFPEGFQILCANCNWIKRYENNEVRQCPNKIY